MSIPRLATATATALAVALIVAGGLAPQAANAGLDRTTTLSLTVKTPYGSVEGKKLGGAQAFLGIPFAEAPIYERQWKAPVAPSKWSQTRDAKESGDACLQFQPTGIKTSEGTSLDCLNLDIYRPAKVKKGEKLPVMLFYHGGGSTQGTANIYGGQTMADRTNTIVIATNYRLGALGGMSLPSLDEEDPKLGSGNFALLDQVEALKWVQKSISSFGGDENNVTIFGQSAGGSAVCNLLATPLAKGLFDRAIMQSITCGQTGRSVETARATSEKFAASVGCPAANGNQPACLRNVWPADLVTAYKTTAITSGVVGTPVLPLASGAAIAAGTWNKVPVIVGNTRWENRLLNVAADLNITADAYQARVVDRYGPAAAALVLDKYSVAEYGTPFQASAALASDSGFGCTLETQANLFVDQAPVYRYQFDDPTGPTLFGFQPPGVDMSNGHSAELAYLFDFTLGDKPLTKKQQKLGYAMQDYWAAFAKTGAPGAAHQPTWPEWNKTTHTALVFAPKIATTTTLNEQHNCAFFASLPPK